MHALSKETECKKKKNRCSLHTYPSMGVNRLFFLGGVLRELEGFRTTRHANCVVRTIPKYVSEVAPR